MNQKIINLLRLAWQQRITQSIQDRIVTTRCPLCKAMTPHSYERHLQELYEVNKG